MTLRLLLGPSATVAWLWGRFRPSGRDVVRSQWRPVSAALRLPDRREQLDDIGLQPDAQSREGH